MVDQAVAATGNVTLVLVVSYPPSRGGTQVAFWDAATGGNRITATTTMRGTLKTWIMPASGTFDSTIWVSGVRRVNNPIIDLVRKGSKQYLLHDYQHDNGEPARLRCLAKPRWNVFGKHTCREFSRDCGGTCNEFWLCGAVRHPRGRLAGVLPPGGKVVLVQELHDNQLFGNYATPSFDDDASLSYYKHKILPPYPTQSNQKFKDSPIATNLLYPNGGFTWSITVAADYQVVIPGTNTFSDYILGCVSFTWYDKLGAAELAICVPSSNNVSTVITEPSEKGYGVMAVSPNADRNTAIRNWKEPNARRRGLCHTTISFEVR